MDSTIISTSTQSRLGTTTPIGSSFLTVQATSTNSILVSLRSFLNQVADIFQIQDSEGNDIFTVSGGGSIGIATSTPSQLLSVQGNALISGNLFVADLIATGTTKFGGVTYTWPSSVVAGNFLQTDSSGNLIWASMSVAGGSDANWSFVSTDGGYLRMASTTNRIGIGTTTPYAKLSIGSVSGAGVAGVGTTTLALQPVSGQLANILDIYDTSGALTSVINSSNNFGLGTTSPSQRLSVGGNGLFSGGLFVEGLTQLQAINSSSTATSTFAGGISTAGLSSGNGLTISGGNILQTNANATNTLQGLNISAGGLKIATVQSCSGSSSLTTDSSGNIICGTSTQNLSGFTDSGTHVHLTTQTDNLSIGTTTPDSRSVVTIAATSTTANLLTLKTLSGQTGNPFVLQDIASSTLFYIGPNGGLVSSASSTFSQNLNVTGALSASSSLAVNGLSTLTNIYASSSSTFANSLSVARLLQAGGGINSSSTATSTFQGGISSAGLNSSSGLTITTGSINLSSGATSTFNNGLKLSAGCFEDSTGNCVGKDSSTLGGFTSS